MRECAACDIAIAWIAAKDSTRKDRADDRRLGVRWPPLPASLSRFSGESVRPGRRWATGRGRTARQQLFEIRRGKKHVDADDVENTASGMLVFYVSDTDVI
jgi:hypothetical protein